MDLTIWEPFAQACREHLPKAIADILREKERVSAIGFITVEDFYGCYMTWGVVGEDVNEFYEWKHSYEPNPDFLYQPLVDVVEDDRLDVDFTRPSDELWAFATKFLSVLKDAIDSIPDAVFQENGYDRSDILFFAAQADGDYVDELLEESIPQFNTPETVQKYGWKPL